MVTFHVQELLKTLRAFCSAQLWGPVRVEFDLVVEMIKWLLPMKGKIALSHPPPSATGSSSLPVFDIWLQCESIQEADPLCWSLGVTTPISSYHSYLWKSFPILTGKVRRRCDKLRYNACIIYPKDEWFYFCPFINNWRIITNYFDYIPTLAKSYFGLKSQREN